jgi:hypothetical protein
VEPRFADRLAQGFRSLALLRFVFGFQRGVVGLAHNDILVEMPLAGLFQFTCQRGEIGECSS